MKGLIGFVVVLCLVFTEAKFNDPVQMLAEAKQKLMELQPNYAIRGFSSIKRSNEATCQGENAPAPTKASGLKYCTSFNGKDACCDSDSENWAAFGAAIYGLLGLEMGCLAYNVAEIAETGTCKFATDYVACACLPATNSTTLFDCINVGKGDCSERMGNGNGFQCTRESGSTKYSSCIAAPDDQSSGPSSTGSGSGSESSGVSCFGYHPIPQNAQDCESAFESMAKAYACDVTCDPKTSDEQYQYNLYVCDKYCEDLLTKCWKPVADLLKCSFDSCLLNEDSNGDPETPPPKCFDGKQWGNAATPVLPVFGMIAVISIALFAVLF